MADDLKIVIPILPDTSDGAKTKFQNSIRTFTDGLKDANAPKIELTVSKINGSSAIKTFKREIEEAIGKFGTTVGKNSIVNQDDFKKLKELQTLKNSLNKQWISTPVTNESKRAEILKQFLNTQSQYNALLEKTKLSEKQLNDLIEMRSKHTQKMKITQADNDDKQQKVRLKQIEDATKKKQELASKQRSAQIKSDMEQRQKEAIALAKLQNINNSRTVKAKLANTSKDIEKFKAVGGDPKVIDELTTAYNQARKAGVAFKDAIENKGGKGADDYYKQYLQQLEKIKNTTSVLNNNDQTAARYNKEKQALNNLILQMQRYEKANDKIKTSPKFSGELSSLKKQSTQAYKVGDYKQVARLTDEFKRLQRGMQDAGLEGQRFGTKLKNQFEKLGVYFSASVIMLGTIVQIKKMISNVIELDSAMTELKKVTDETDVTYARFLDNAENRAKRVGATLTDTVKATAEFARLGYGLQDAEKLSDASIIYKNVADGITDIGESSATIISAMKSFGVESNNVMQIVDKFNEVGNKYAVSSKDIGESLRMSSSALATAGNSMDESVGMIVAMNETIRDASVTGTALKTISMRLRNTSDSLRDMGEDAEGAEESVTKLQQKIKSLSGIDIMKDKDSFKSTYQIMTELSKVWDKLTDKSRADLTKLIGGVHQGNTLNAMLSNMSSGMKATETAMNSFGKQNCQYVQKCA